MAVLAHSVVDFFSFVVIPLLSVIEGRVHLTKGQTTLLLASGPIASGLVQPLIALLSDRHDTRRLGTVGCVLAVLAIGSIGYATEFWQLLLLYVIGAAGIGAFHPVAAATVGQLAGVRRSQWIAWFYAAGMVGGVLGNVVSPTWVAHFGHGDAGAGLRSLAWWILPGLATAVGLAWAIHSMPHRHATARQEHAALAPEERAARWTAIWLLYSANVLRFMVDMCLILLIHRWSESLALEAARATELVDAVRMEAAEINGPLQAAKQVGMGLGGLALGWFVGRRYERVTLIGVPLLGAVAIATLPHMGGFGALAVCAVAGFGYAGVMPITISMAQRLLPHRTSLASALMMGGAWSVGALGRRWRSGCTTRPACARRSRWWRGCWWCRQGWRCSEDTPGMSGGRLCDRSESRD